MEMSEDIFTGFYWLDAKLGRKMSIEGTVLQITAAINFILFDCPVLSYWHLIKCFGIYELGIINL